MWTTIKQQGNHNDSVCRCAYQTVISTDCTCSMLALLFGHTSFRMIWKQRASSLFILQAGVWESTSRLVSSNLSKRVIWWYLGWDNYFLVLRGQAWLSCSCKFVSGDVWEEYVLCRNVLIYGDAETIFSYYMDFFSVMGFQAMAGQFRWAQAFTLVCRFVSTSSSPTGVLLPGSGNNYVCRLW